jgi:hypothetical protein
MVSAGAIKERKERKGWESNERELREQGWGRKSLVSIQGLRINLGRAASVHCFSDVSAES